MVIFEKVKSDNNSEEEKLDLQIFEDCNAVEMVI